MPRTFQVDLETTAMAMMTVTLTDEQLQEIRVQQGVENISDLTLDMLSEAVKEEALNEAPALCASCRGWGRYEILTMSLDEWDVAKDEPKYRYRAVREK